MLVYSLSGIIISAIASIYPAYYATKLNPVEIMKNS
jgi:ABC-type antimicrobial peptide transport system permease subunit